MATSMILVFAPLEAEDPEHGLKKQSGSAKQEDNEKETSKLPKVKCKACNRIFFHEQALRNHLWGKHAAHDSPAESSAKNAKKTKSDPNKGKNTPAIKAYKCTYCNKKFRTRGGRVSHEDDKHPTEVAETTEPTVNPVQDITNDTSQNVDIKQDVTEPKITKEMDSINEKFAEVVTNDSTKNRATKQEVTEPEVTKDMESIKEIPAGAATNCAKKHDTKQEAAKPENIAEKDSKKENQKPPGSPLPSNKCETCGETFIFSVMLSGHYEETGHGPHGPRAGSNKKPVEKPKDEIKEGLNELDAYVFTLHGNFYNDLTPFKKREIACLTFGRSLRRRSSQKKADKFGCLLARNVDVKISLPSLRSFRAHSEIRHGISYVNASPFLTKAAPKDIDNSTKQASMETSNTANRAPKDADNSTKHVSKWPGFRCIPCNKSFRAEHTLEQHWEDQHSNTWWSLFDEDNLSDVSLTYSEFENDGEDMFDDFMETLNKDEQFRSGKINCITCWKKFKTTSRMMDHVEAGKCHSHIDRKDIESVIKKHMGDVVARCYNPNVKDKFECPVCKQNFHSLSYLIGHAEGTQWSLSITKGPLKEFISELKWRLIEDNHYFD
ncbi:zinc finger domain protein [Fusarium beomiforme]|uniref:Zinc finger domain protein n=1 Tax=Fusarium beomiforme TaxID=44412 RepID=A0A9P5AH34_9HYPO|nr:zinc finger domain protein [Fusarium beomiforme]